MAYNARKEIERACKRENPDWDGKCFDYGCSIYQNALECYEAIQPIIEKAGHSGFSYGIFINVLNKLLKRKILTPITEEDFPEIGEHVCERDDGVITSQCPRYTALFRDTYPDGSVTYHDVDRIAVIDQNGLAWHSGDTEKKCKEFIPEIELPYLPSDECIKIYVVEFTYENERAFIKPGEYNSVYIQKIVFPDGTVKQVDRLYLDDVLVENYDKNILKEIERN